MVFNSFTPLCLFSHKTGTLNTSVRVVGRGNVLQLIQWVRDWLAFPIEADGYEGSFLIGVVPDALVAKQLKKALPHLNIITGDEAPKERKRIFKKLDGDTPQRVIITLREALPWLRQNPQKAVQVWTWGHGVHQCLPNTGAAILVQNRCTMPLPLNHTKRVHYSRVWYWGKTVSAEVRRCLESGHHRLLWVTLGITRLEQHRIEEEARAFCLNPAQLHVALPQHVMQSCGLEQVTAFLSRPNSQVLYCDSAVFSSLLLPQTDDDGIPLHYHLILESRASKSITHPEDLLHAYPWCSVRHYTKEWWRIR
jgi:hypothetical protein